MNEKERADIIELLWCLKTAAGVCWEKLLEVERLEKR